MTEVPQHLLDRTKRRRAQMSGDQERIDAQAAAEAAQARAARAQMMSLKNKLPNICRGCVLRPEDTGGNGGCAAVNETLVHLKTVSEELELPRAKQERLSPHVALLVTEIADRDVRDLTRGGPPTRTWAEPADGEPDALTAISDIGTAASGRYRWYKGLLNSFNTIDGVSDAAMPEPQGVAIQACMRGLADMVRPEVVRDSVSILNAAIVLNDARGAGVILTPPSA